MSERTYSPDEFRVIIRKALELEARISANPSQGQGLTRDEVISIAGESGISEDSVRAILDDNRPQVSAGRKVAGMSASPEIKPVIRGEEMSVEQWISINPTTEMIELLLTELDNRFHTSDKESWWSSLWGENVKVKKTTRSTEWKFTDKDSEMTTRVLLQSRGDRFRIRVSRKQSWGIGWDLLPNVAFIPLPVLSIAGGILGYHFITSSIFGVFMGIGAGLALAGLSFPFVRALANRITQNHVNDLTELSDELVDYALELHDEVGRTPQGRTSESTQKKNVQRPTEIEVLDEEDGRESTGGLRNQLRN